MVKKTPSAGARERARNLRRDMTEAEQRLWQMPRSRQTEGYRFRRQMPIGGFIADFICHAAKLIVEIDGGQHDPSSEAEASRTRFLEAEGYRVLRFRNNEVLDNPEGVRAAVADALPQGSPSPIRPVAPTPIEPVTPTHIQSVTPTRTLPHRWGRVGSNNDGNSRRFRTAHSRSAAPARRMPSRARRGARPAGSRSCPPPRWGRVLCFPPPRWGRVGVGVTPRTDPW
jgi:very-short-patch-repair endonuclease